MNILTSSDIRSGLARSALSRLYRRLRKATSTAERFELKTKIGMLERMMQSAEISPPPRQDTDVPA